MNRVYKASLSLKDLRKLNKDIRYYKNVILPSKEEELLEALSDAGIRVARMNCGQYGSYIGFVKMVYSHKYNYKCSAVFTGFNERPNVAEWVNSKGVHTAIVNSLMMAEYGSGQYALYNYRGTFPNNENRKSYGLRDKWFYATEYGQDGKPIWIEASGVAPTMPMYKAWYEMKTSIYVIARRVFNT